MEISHNDDYDTRANKILWLFFNIIKQVQLKNKSMLKKNSTYFDIPSTSDHHHNLKDDIYIVWYVLMVCPSCSVSCQEKNLNLFFMHANVLMHHILN